jgi:hypothetical protein
MIINKYLIVVISRLEQSQSSLCGVVGCQNGIRFLSRNFILTNNDSVGNLANKSINMDTKVNLSNIAVLNDMVFRF